MSERIDALGIELLTIAEAAEAIGVSERTMWRYIAKGKPQAVKRGGQTFVPANRLADAFEAYQPPSERTE